MTDLRTAQRPTSVVSIPQVVVVGCPSADRLELAGQVHEVIGGAGLLTALAARRTGARVGLVARVPIELPAQVAVAFGDGGLDPGGLAVHAGSLPSFHIVYDGAEQASYLVAEGGMEAEVVADDLPQEWLGADIVHIASLGGRAETQLAFAQELRARGFAGLLSAGTYIRSVKEETETVRALRQRCDLFFCNLEESRILFPDGPLPNAPGTLCVTLGSQGARVHQAGQVRQLQPEPGAVLVEPTGAGDAFCGGYLGALATGTDPLASGLRTARVAISAVGGQALASGLRDGPRQPVQVRAQARSEGVARMDAARVATLAGRFREVASASALDFTGPQFPAVDAAHVVALFAQATAHQFGFWHADDAGFVGPMWATLDGRRYKGSDFVWHAFSRAARLEPELLDPARMAADPVLFDRITTADDGRSPVPAIGLHRSLHLALGAHLLASGPIEALVERANATPMPIRALLDQLRHVPGFGEDRLAKKATLLAIILGNRPERFLTLRDPDTIRPIVDYHLMRGCLRTGCVQVEDPAVRATMEQRAWLAPAGEAAVRDACYEALEALVSASGVSVAAVDGFFFVNGRSKCIEVGTVDCPACPIREACGRHTAMFQPIVRTDAY